MLLLLMWTVRSLATLGRKHKHALIVSNDERAHPRTWQVGDRKIPTLEESSCVRLVYARMGPGAEVKMEAHVIAAFEAYDTDHSGTIDAAELGLLLNRLRER